MVSHCSGAAPAKDGDRCVFKCRDIQEQVQEQVQARQQQDSLAPEPAHTTRVFSATAAAAAAAVFAELPPLTLLRLRLALVQQLVVVLQLLLAPSLASYGAARRGTASRCRCRCAAHAAAGQKDGDPPARLHSRDQGSRICWV